MSDISRTAVIQVPDYMWDKVNTAIRALRELHRDAGGTSKVRKKGMRVTVTFTGTPGAVQFGMQNLAKVKQAVENTRSQIHQNLFAKMRRSEEERRAEVLDMILSELTKQKGKK